MPDVSVNGMLDTSQIQENLSGVAWEYHSIQLNRVPGYGFGIAVSGGRDNPHFANGDPAIAISDVLKSGPAEGKLLVNDRILSANGISLENVDYATAVQVLRDSGPSVQLVVKRRVVLPQGENSTFKVTLSRKKRSDDFGIILGCKLYIKEVTNKLADKENTINEGDIILKINSNNTDGMTLKEAKKLIENSKEKLHLIVKRDNSGCSNTGFQLSAAATNGTQPQFKGNNYLNLELLDSRGPSYSSQNLYVQPPTRDARDAGRMNRSMEEDKNNLMRMRRGPGQEQQQQLYDPPPRPPPPRPDDIIQYPEQEVYSSSRRQLVFDQVDSQPQTATSPPPPQSHRVPSEPRFVTFVKEAGSVGIRLMGGNRTGIYVAAVQSQSPAAMQGIQPGDKILKVNDTELVNMTREDAVLLLLNLQDAISMLVQFKPDEFEGVKQNGDSFYIKTHFNYEQPRKNETPFKRGEIFHVTDTLHNGTVGSYEAYRVTKSGQDGEKGVIPNKTHAEEFALKDMGKKEGNEVTKTGSFFRRRKSFTKQSGRRSKSLNYEEIYSEAIKFPAYERVILKHPAFIRPVVLFGPVADIARERLLRDYPEKFAVPSAAGDNNDSAAPRPIRLSGIKQIIEQNKHALIDVTPHGVERLTFAQLYPIVLFLKAESKQAVKEIRNGVINNKQQTSLSILRAPKRRPSTKKLFEDSLKLERNYGHIITATLNLTESWYRRIRDAIDREQTKMIWAANVKSPGGDPLNHLVEDDFFLFPSVTSPRYSYASSPESEDVEAGELKDSSSPLVNKSTSDPSINGVTQDLGSVQLPNYNAPPPYSINMTGGQNGFVQDVFRITKKQRDYTPPPHQPVPQTNPPTLPKNSKLILTHSPPDSPISHNPDFSPPPQIDRSKKPSGFGKSATERLFMDSSYGASGESRQDTHIGSPLRNGNTGLHENGNYDNGNYRWTPQQLHQQQQHVNGMIDHDVYRFTRLTALTGRESSPSKISYAMSNGNGTPRSGNSHYKPPPPPKAQYKPVPPPKPTKLYSNYNTAPTTTENNYMNGKSPDPSLNDNHDSGHGSSLDRTIISSRNYNKYVYPSSRMTNPTYLNVPPPKNQTQQHQPIDLINREQRGSSAFELYRKPSELCPPPQHHQRVYRNTNARGIFTKDGGRLECSFRNVGFLLMIIPPGALPPGVKEEIYIKVVHGGGSGGDDIPIDNIKGEKMLTPILEFGPPGLKFLRPVEVRLSKPAGALQRTLKLKSSNEPFWKEMDLDEENDAGGEISTILINQF